MKLQVHGMTDVGRVRRSNEDAFLVEPELGIFAVADGVGGMPGGEVASCAAINFIRHGLAQGGPALRDLEALAQGAHHAVRAAARAGHVRGACTTLTLARIEDGRVTIAHVGDSFALLIRGGVCLALTREHNEENDSPVEARPLGGWETPHALTRVLGQPEPLEPELFSADLRAGDVLVLATDGLTDLVPFERVALLGVTSGDARMIAEALVVEALAADGRDNITVVVVRIQ